MKFNLKLLPGLLIFIFMFQGCATYNITTENFAKQYANSQQENHGYLGADVKGNSITSLSVTDQKGVGKTVAITDRTMVRITKIDQSSTTFYFNTLVYTDSTISGSKTHFFNAKIKPIKIMEIVKMEILP